MKFYSSLSSIFFTDILSTSDEEFVSTPFMARKRVTSQEQEDGGKNSKAGRLSLTKKKDNTNKE